MLFLLFFALFQSQKSPFESLLPEKGKTHSKSNLFYWLHWSILEDPLITPCQMEARPSPWRPYLWCLDGWFAVFLISVEFKTIWTLPRNSPSGLRKKNIRKRVGVNPKVTQQAIKKCNPKSERTTWLSLIKEEFQNYMYKWKKLKFDTYLYAKLKVI